MGIPTLAINSVYSEQRSNVSETFSTYIIRESFLLCHNIVLAFYLLTTVVKEDICVCDAVNM
jgi:hypothetical protein